MLFAWAMKFNRKYVGPIYTTPNNRESASCRNFFEGAWTLKSKSDSFLSLNSLSEKSERDLPASERASEKTVGESLTGLPRGVWTCASLQRTSTSGVSICAQ